MMQRALLVLVAAWMSAGLAAQTVDDVVAKAQAFLGGAERINSLQSLEYRGTFTMLDSGETGEVVIQLKKPLMHRREVRTGQTSRITATDSIVCWNLAWNNDQPERKVFEYLDRDQSRRFLASTYENLFFFRPNGRPGSSARLEGLRPIGADMGLLVVFSHGPGVNYQRFFEPTTGRLIATIDDSGSETREEGEQFINGLRFPRSITNSVEGTARLKVDFHTILVNPELPDTLFTVPTGAITGRW